MDPPSVDPELALVASTVAGRLVSEERGAKYAVVVVTRLSTGVRRVVGCKTRVLHRNTATRKTSG
jgi:hypothetical protein